MNTPSREALYGFCCSNLKTLGLHFGVVPVREQFVPKGELKATAA